MFCEYCLADEMAVRSVIADMKTYCVTARIDSVSSIEQWGFSSRLKESGVMTNAYMALSNNWQYAMNDWTFYSTNAVARQFFVNLCGFAGTNTLIGVWNRMLDINATNANACPPMLILRLHNAPSSPLEEYVVLHYDNPAISNCLLRTRLMHPQGTAWCQFYDEVLSGERKRDWEDEHSVNWDE